MYKSVVVKFDIKARSAAEAIDTKANELEEKGLALVSVAFITESKAVATFHGSEEAVASYNEELAALCQEREAQKARDKEDAKAWHDEMKAQAEARKNAKRQKANKKSKKHN